MCFSVPKRALLLEIATLLFTIGAVAKLLDLWLQPVVKSRLQQRIRDLSSALENSDPLVVIKAPLQLASIVLERIYGRRLLSWKAFGRATVLSTALILFSLTVSGIASGGRFQRLLKKSGDHREKDSKPVIARPLQGGSPEISSPKSPDAKILHLKFVAADWKLV